MLRGSEKLGIRAWGFVPVLLLVLASAAGAQTASAGPVAEAAARGLIGGKLTSDLHTDTVPVPPAGVEVDQYHASSIVNAQNANLEAWNEPLGEYTLHTEVGRRADGAAMVSWWVLPKSAPGCLLYIYKIFDPAGRVVRSEYWSRTNVIKTNTGSDFPADLYPFGPGGGIPPSAIVHALQPVAKGATGRLYTQYTYDSFVVLDAWADRIEDVTLPAGTFRALHVTMRPNPSSFLPSWPGFVLKVIDHFMPQESFYFQADPPHRFLEYEGIPGATGPKLTMELVSYRSADDSKRIGLR